MIAGVGYWLDSFGGLILFPDDKQTLNSIGGTPSMCQELPFFLMVLVSSFCGGGCCSSFCLLDSARWEEIKDGRGGASGGNCDYNLQHDHRDINGGPSDARLLP